MNPRSFSRKVFLGNVLVCPLPRGRRFAANSLNISEGGLALHCRDYLKPGSPVELRLRAGQATATKLLGRVTNVRVEDDGNVLGVAFACPLTSEEKQTLYDELGVRISI